MSLSDEVRKHVDEKYVHPARQRGEAVIRVRAGDVHRDLHWTNRVPSVCTTLSSQKFQEAIDARLIAREGPPSGYGTRATFTYRLSLSGRTRGPAGKKLGRLLDLYGVAAGAFRQLGGGEKYIREERRKLNFQYDVEARANGKEDK